MPISQKIVNSLNYLFICVIVFYMDKMKNPLGYENINKLILKFSIPAIAGMMINALYNVVDRIYIGNHPDLGMNGLAGIALGFPIMLILLAFGVLFGVGGATLFSIRLGEGKPEESKKVLSTAFFLLVGSSLLYMFFGKLFLEDLLRLFGGSDQIIPYSIEYMDIILYGATFQILSMGLNHFVRADGSPKIAMYTMFLGAGVNIILDPIFIFVFNWGMFGAAFATVLAQTFSAAWVLLYFRGKRSRIKMDTFVFVPSIATKIVSLGFPGFSLQLANSMVMSVLNRSLAFYGGDLAISAMGILQSIQTFMIMPVIGLNQGTIPIISFNWGAKQYDRVRETMKYALWYAFGITSIGYLATRLFPGFLVGIFNKDDSLLELMNYAMFAWFFVVPIIGPQIIASNFFQAIGRSKMALFLTLTRQVIILIPAILILPTIWGLDGLLFSAPLSDGLSFIITSFFFIRTYKELSTLKHEQDRLNLPEDALEEGIDMC